MISFLFRSSPLLLAVACLVGCSSIPLDPAHELVAVYQFGEFKMLLNTNAPKATTAIQKAMKDFDLYVTQTISSTYRVEFEARARNDQKVTVVAEEINSRQSLLHIRWGAGGNKQESRRLYEAIETNLTRVR